MTTATLLRQVASRVRVLRGSDMPENAVVAIRELVEICAAQQREIDELRRVSHKNLTEAFV